MEIFVYKFNMLKNIQKEKTEKNKKNKTHDSVFCFLEF